jgi:hypothetical protein
LGVAGITSLGGTTLTVNTPGTLTFNTATEVTDSSLTAPTGVTLEFAAATALQNVNLSATGGGEILFPVATSYTGYNYADTTIEASGAGSRIDLSHLTTFTAAGSIDGGVYGRRLALLQQLREGPWLAAKVDLAGAISHGNNHHSGRCRQRTTAWRGYLARRHQR